jgi:hypothetical protein
MTALDIFQTLGVIANTLMLVYLGYLIGKVREK